jgi:hypothetical protein
VLFGLKFASENTVDSHGGLAVHAMEWWIFQIIQILPYVNDAHREINRSGESTSPWRRLGSASRFCLWSNKCFHMPLSRSRVWIWVHYKI